MLDKYWKRKENCEFTLDYCIRKKIMFFFSKYHKLYIIWYPVLFFNLSRNKIRLFAHDFMSYKFIVNSFEEEIFSKWNRGSRNDVSKLNEVLKLQQVHFEIGNEIESDIDNSRDDISSLWTKYWNCNRCMTWLNDVFSR